MTTTLLDTSKGIVEFTYKGIGPAILLLKGEHSSRNTDLSHSSLIYEGFSLLTISRPGYDCTQTRTGRTPEEFAATIIEVLDHLNIASISVIAVSTAGPTGLYLAAKHPERISRLIMEAALTNEFENNKKRPMKTVQTMKKRVSLNGFKSLLKFFPDLAIKQLLAEMTTEDSENYLEKLSPNDRRFLYDLLATSHPSKRTSMNSEQSIPDLKQIQVPVLGMYSQDDKYIPYTNALLLKSKVPNCEIFEVDAGSHFIWIGKNARKVWDKRIEFLTQDERSLLEV